MSEMREVTRRSVGECVLFGLIAGSALALAGATAFLAWGLPGDRPLRVAASLLAGERALLEPAGATVVMVGLGVHLALSAAFGAAYGLFNAWMPEAWRRHFSDQAALGCLFGFAVFAVTYLVVGPARFPWVVAPPLALQALLHALAFGGVIGLLYARAERRVPVV